MYIIYALMIFTLTHVHVHSHTFTCTCQTMMQQARGGRCDNPTFKDCLQNAVTIRAQKSLELDRVRGNCRGGKRKRLTMDAEPLKIDSTPLPKHKRTVKRHS